MSPGRTVSTVGSAAEPSGAGWEADDGQKSGQAYGQESGQESATEDGGRSCCGALRQTDWRTGGLTDPLQ